MSKPSTAITIPNPLPATLVALDEHVVGLVAGIVDELQAYADLPAFSDADADAVQELFRRAQKLEREIEASRTALKRPILDLGKALDEAAKGATVPLASAREAVKRPLLLWQKAKEEEARRIEEERRRAIEEQRRLEREAAAEAARLQAEAAANADDPLATMLGMAPAQVELPPVPQVYVPEKPTAVAKAVKTVRRARLVMVDDSYIKRSVTGPDGTVYRLMVPDERAIKQALEAGLQVSQGGEGARLEWEEHISSTGR